MVMGWSHEERCILYGEPMLRFFEMCPGSVRPLHPWSRFL